jgi:branched-chain amino acid transport system substrate-binding protein
MEIFKPARLGIKETGMTSRAIGSVLLAACAAIATCASYAAAPTQGISKNEIVIGSIQDLSGPIAGYGKQTRFGMMLRVDEINEQGGINGRKVRLIVEDSAYDPKRALLAAQKLVNQDKVFMMLAHIGTAHNLASMPVLFDKNIVNFFPLSNSREMFEPPSPLKIAVFPPTFEMSRLNLPKMVKEKNLKTACTLYQDDETGLEIMRGGEEGLKGINMSYAEKTSFKRGATDFSSQVAKMKAGGCDLVLLGTLIRETIGTLSEARKIGFNPVFLASQPAYSDLIHKLGGPTVNGLYATMTAQHPYLDDASPALRFWANKYMTKFNEEPTVFSTYGYNAVDAFVQAAAKAGPGLSTESFVKAMDSISFPQTMFGQAPATFGPTKRLGSGATRLSQIVDGRWKVVSDYAKP